MATPYRATHYVAALAASLPHSPRVQEQAGRGGKPEPELRGRKDREEKERGKPHLYHEWGGEQVVLGGSGMYDQERIFCVLLHLTPPCVQTNNFHSVNSNNLFQVQGHFHYRRSSQREVERERHGNRQRARENERGEETMKGIYHHSP